MTGIYMPSQQILIARQWVGFHEGPNNQQPFSYWQYGDSHESWCVSFMSYCAWHGGFRFPFYSQYGERGDSSCYYLRTHAMRAGTWRSVHTVAHPGWPAIFNFGTMDQHCETVISDQGGPTFATIGGNTSSGVYYRTRYRSQCEGFVALDEAGQNYENAAPGVTIYPSQEVNMSVLVPAGAHVTGGRSALYKVDASGIYLACQNGAHAKWRGTPAGKNPADYNTGHAFGPGTTLYKIPQNTPHVDVIQMHDPDTLLPQKIGAVIGADGGCAFFDMILP